MKKALLTTGALAALLALPLTVNAQQQGQPQQTQAQAPTTPSESRMTRHWTKRFGSLNLSDQQRQQVQSYIHQYSQAHPEGSPRDQQATRALRQQIMGVLTTDQQNQYRQQRQQHRAQAQQQNQQGPPSSDQQAPPSQPPG